jgi:5-methylcytosine-specific restriction endonuclease McrA
MTAADKRAYSKVADRADGVCEGCGSAEAEQMHHRKFRSRGGKHTPANLLHLCFRCHALAHTHHGPEGHALHSWDDPLKSVVQHAAHGLVFLDDLGGYRRPE